MRSIDSGEWVEGHEERGVCCYEVISIDRHYPHSPLKVKIIRLLGFFAVKSKSPIRRRADGRLSTRRRCALRSCHLDDSAMQHLTHIILIIWGKIVRNS